MSRDQHLLLYLAVPLASLLGFLGVILWRDRRTGTRRPVKDRLLRSPGESLRTEVAKLDEKGTLILVGMILFATVAGYTLPFPPRLPIIVTVFLVNLAAAFWVMSVGVKRSNYDLGLSGEKAVAEELNRLMSHGCFVFHDFPADPAWNIDHIVVAPSGLFAVETKTRRKRKSPPQTKEHQVIFDGQSLHFPNGRDFRCVFQTESNARWLSQYLSKALGASFAVTPILTLPGWWIDRKGKGAVNVLAPKEIRKLILSGGRPALSAQEIKRIVDHLDQRCRDVEF